MKNDSSFTFNQKHYSTRTVIRWKQYDSSPSDAILSVELECVNVVSQMWESCQKNLRGNLRAVYLPILPVQHWCGKVRARSVLCQTVEMIFVTVRQEESELITLARIKVVDFKISEGRLKLPISDDRVRSLLWLDWCRCRFTITPISPVTLLIDRSRHWLKHCWLDHRLISWKL